MSSEDRSEQTSPDSASGDDATRTKPQRLVSLDAWRGFVMVTLTAAGFGFAKTAENLGFWPSGDVEGSYGRVWHWLGFHTSHSHYPGWNSQFYVIGLTYWDLIHSAFALMVGVSMPYSFARRKAAGDSALKLCGHAALRALILILLGVFLYTQKGFDNNRLFLNVLAQIGLGYFFVFLLLGRIFRVQVTVAVIVLVGYWALMISWPVPDPLPQAAVTTMETLNVPPSIGRHFAKDVNVGAAFDYWLLSHIPRATPLEFHRYGYVTLNFIPSAITTLFGVMAGQLLFSSRDQREKLRLLLLGGLVCMLLALAGGYTVCPIIKTIWTPTWTLYSGAWVIWMLAFFYWLIDIRGSRWWTFPLVVVGMNPLAIYMMSMLLSKWTASRLQVYFGSDIFAGAYGPAIEATTVFAVYWLACWYMYRNKMFLRI